MGSCTLSERCFDKPTNAGQAVSHPTCTVLPDHWDKFVTPLLAKSAHTYIPFLCLALNFGETACSNVDPALYNKIQKAVVDSSRHGIGAIFAEECQVWLPLLNPYFVPPCGGE